LFNIASELSARESPRERIQKDGDRDRDLFYNVNKIGL
jgi:hypothetical protein